MRVSVEVLSWEWEVPLSSGTGDELREEETMLANPSAAAFGVRGTWVSTGPVACAK